MSSRIADVHKPAVLKFMKKNPSFAFGRVTNTPANSQTTVETMKQRLADAVNEVGGVNFRPKTAKEAFRSWTDWKNGVLRRKADLVSYAKGTGGGEPMMMMFTELEEELLEF